MTSIAMQRLQWKLILPRKQIHGNFRVPIATMPRNICANELFETAGIMHFRGNKLRSCEIEPWEKVLSIVSERTI
jgi:hypothetical protein